MTLVPVHRALQFSVRVPAHSLICPHASCALPTLWTVPGEQTEKCFPDCRVPGRYWLLLLRSPFYRWKTLRF